MSTVSIVYHSGSGHTTKMAEAVAKGAGSVNGVKANLLAISGKDIAEGRFQNDALLAQLDASDAVIFGSPTYMGGPSGSSNVLPTPRANVGTNPPGRIRSLLASLCPVDQAGTN